MLKFFFLFTILSLFIGAGLFAQDLVGGISGSVVMEDHTPVENVRITVSGENLTGTMRSVSDHRGKFRFHFLPPGKYLLRFRCEGFKRLFLKSLKIQAGKFIKVRVVMVAGGLKEEVQIDASSTVLDVGSSSSSVSLSEDDINKIPKDRDYLSIITTQGGIIKESVRDEEALSLNGAGVSENNFFVDGMNVTAVEDGRSGQKIDYDWIEEVQVKASGYAAEFSGGIGGCVSVITKSGGNRYSGNLSLYCEPSFLRGNPAGNLEIDPENYNNAVYADVNKDRGFQLEAGASLGGYIVKDHLWFFTSFMPRYIKVERPGRFIDSPENDGEIFVQRNRGYKGTAKLSASISERVRVNFSSILNRYRLKNQLPEVAGTTSYSTSGDLDLWAETSTMLTLTGNIDIALTESAFLNLSTGYFRTNSFYSGEKVLEGNRILFVNANSHLNISSDLKKPASFQNMSLDELIKKQKNINDRLSIKGDLTWYVDGFGEHVFKSGLMWRRVAMDIDNGTSTEYWRFYWKNGTQFSSFYTNDGEEIPLDYGYVRSYLYGFKGDLNTERWALYFQDSWSVTDRLTLNIGVRFEQEEMPSMDDSIKKPAFKFSFLDKIAPRIGFALDINGDGKNKVFGSWGIYYDAMKLSLATRVFGGFQNRLAWYNIKDPDWTKYLNVSSVLWTGSYLPVLGGQLLEIADYSTAMFNRVQPDIKPFSKIEAALGYQKALDDDWLISMRLLFHKVLNAIEDIGVMNWGVTQYYIGNPGSDWVNQLYRSAAADGHMPAGVTCPDVKREFYSFQLNIDKKFSNNWMGGASLTLSRLWGNFSGLVETGSEGSLAVNTQRYFDAWYSHYYNGTKEATGLLPADRPLQLKLYGAYTFNNDLTVGINGFFLSGTPVSRFVELNSDHHYLPDGRFTDSRTPFYWQLDLYMEKTFKLKGNARLSLIANISNLTNNKIARSVFSKITEEVINLTNSEIVKGFNIYDVMNARRISRDPRFLKKHDFQQAFRMVLGARLNF